MRDDLKFIPLDILRDIVSEPLPPGDEQERTAQADRIRELVKGQPVQVRVVARRMLKARWDKLAGLRRT
jgi:hypothetical protein